MKFTKEETEKAIADRFFSLYNSRFKTNLIAIRNGVQGSINEPDIICNNGLNIEIVSTHYSNENTEYVENQIKTTQRATSLTLEGPDNMAFNFIASQIRIKEKKLKQGNYQYKGEILLVIDIRDTPLTTMVDYKDYFEKQPINASGFYEIWLFSDRPWIGKSSQNTNEKEIVDGGIWDDSFIIYKVYIK